MNIGDKVRIVRQNKILYENGFNTVGNYGYICNIDGDDYQLTTGFWYQEKELEKVFDMDAVEFLREKNRLCDHYSDNCICCPLSDYMNKTKLPCRFFIEIYPEKAVEIIATWRKNYGNSDV